MISWSHCIWACSKTVIDPETVLQLVQKWLAINRKFKNLLSLQGWMSWLVFDICQNPVEVDINVSEGLGLLLNVNTSRQRPHDFFFHGLMEVSSRKPGSDQIWNKGLSSCLKDTDLKQFFPLQIIQNASEMCPLFFGFGLSQM